MRLGIQGDQRNDCELFPKKLAYQEYAENDLDNPFKVLEDALQDLNAQHHDLLPSDVTAETF